MVRNGAGCLLRAHCVSLATGTGDVPALRTHAWRQHGRRQGAVRAARQDNPLCWRQVACWRCRARRCTCPRRLLRRRLSEPRRLLCDARTLGATALTYSSAQAASLAWTTLFTPVQLPPTSGLVGSAGHLRRCWPVQTQSAVASCVCCADWCPERAAHRRTRCMRVTYERSTVICLAGAPAGNA